MNTKEKLVNETLKFIAQKGWTNDEREFFDSLSLFLADILQVAYVMINKLKPDGQTAETLSFVSGGVVNPNISYPLTNTPCENVMGKNLCSYVKNIQNLFPKDSMLVDMRAEGYIGIPLWDIKGAPLGLIALLDTKPIENPEELKTILQIVAVRVAHEIERNNYEHELIDKTKKAEESEEKYRLLSDLNHEGLAIHDKGVLLEANKAFYNIFGYSEKELTGKYAIDILFTEESIKILLIKMKQPSGEPYVVEGIHKSGRHLWVELEGRDFTFKGTPVRFVLFRDVTEKKKQEDIILESHKRFKRLTELTNEGILIHKDGIAVDVNPAFERYMGS